ncbi:alpha/beta fold hydrolase [Microbacterium sp. KUDC0406]
MKVVPDAGHLIPQEQPAAVVAAILDVLAQVKAVGTD